MSRTPDPLTALANGVFARDQFTRRQALRGGGAVLTLGALLAACGNTEGSTAPGRLGAAPAAPTLPPLPAQLPEAMVLRTAQSLEYAVIDVHTAAIDSGELSAAERSLAQRLIDDHVAHADAIGTLIGGVGGQPFACANPFVTERAITPLLAAVADSDDAHRDLLNIAYGFENWAGASYQSFVGMLTTGALRREAVRIASEEHRHATALATVINPSQPFAPVFDPSGEADDAGALAAVHAIPSVFGLLNGFELQVGKIDETEGTRYKTQLKPPAANTIVDDTQSC